MQTDNLIYDRLGSQLILVGMTMAFCWKYYPVCLQIDLCIFFILMFVCLFIYLLAQIFIQSFSRTGHELIWYFATPCDFGYLYKDEPFIVYYIIAT